MQSPIRASGRGSCNYSTCMQANRIAIITGVCVGGLAVVLIAVAIGARRTVRTDVYAYSAPGGMGAGTGTTATFAEHTNPISRALSGSGSVSPAPASPNASPHQSPHGPPTYFDVDSPDTGSPRAGRSAAGGRSKPQTVAFGVPGPSSTAGGPSSQNGRLTAAGEDGGGSVAVEGQDLRDDHPFPGIPETDIL